MLRKLMKDGIGSADTKNVFIEGFVCILSIHLCLTVQEKLTVLKKVI